MAIRGMLTGVLLRKDETDGVMVKGLQRMELQKNVIENVTNYSP